MSDWKLDNHIVGKAYHLNQDNMNAMIADLEQLKSENARLRKALQRIADHYEGIDFYFGDIALEALKGGE